MFRMLWEDHQRYARERLISGRRVNSPILVVDVELLFELLCPTKHLVKLVHVVGACRINEQFVWGKVVQEELVIN